MNLFEINKNITTKFILPMICENSITYNNILNKTFLSAYIADYELPEFDDNIILVRLNPMQSGITKNKCIKEYKVNKHFVYVYEIPENYQNDYKLILKDKYSLISENYKNKLLSFWTIDNHSKLFYILYKELFKYQEKDTISVLNWKLPVMSPRKEIYWRV